ncbi:MAG: protein translocase subunit SecF [Candidatus Dadabacteria bacterium]|nr:MAG: protein translocase subunit SecF [Candidatus Dadabacteria bacterium]
MELVSPKLNFDFLAKSKYAVIISLAVICYSFYLWFSLGGDKYGVDYKGGTEVVVQFKKEIKSDKIRKALKESGIATAIVQSFEEGTREFSIRVGGSDESVKANIKKALDSGFKDSYEIEKIDVVGPTIGKELRRKALMAVIFGLVGMLIYISVRFEFAFALGAVVALFHDVVVCTGVYLLCGREISASTLAAALTIVGYSVNDTIIIFDRCREYILKTKKFNLVEVMNASINSTLGRTIITSLLTLFSALALLLYGGGAIADLSLYLVVGVITGTYSTIFIACPVVIAWDKWRYEAKRDSA